MKLPKLKETRERRALSQMELALAAGVSRPTIARIETGASAYPSTARKLATTLRVRPDVLMGPIDTPLDA